MGTEKMEGAKGGEGIKCVGDYNGGGVDESHTLLRGIVSREKRNRIACSLQCSSFC